MFPIDHPDRAVCAGLRTPNHDPAACTQRGKHPAVKFGTAATTDPAQVVGTFAGATYNYGVHTGQAGLVVLDEDTPGGVERAASDLGGPVVPITYTVVTGKGRHLYYRAPPGITLSTTAGAFARYGVDVRAGNSYVVGAGSRHANGGTYELVDDRDPVPLPQWVLDAIQQTKRSTTTGNPVDTGERGLGALPEVIRGPRGDSGGQRHSVFVSFAASLRARRTPRAEAEALMRLAWERCEQPPACTTAAPWEDALSILDHAYRRPEGPSGAYDHGTRATPEPEPPPGDAAFWQSRESLATVHAFARARMVAPWALLGAVLARVVAGTAPWVVLPALVGGHASLNLFVALVGVSGAGKGATSAAAIDAVTVPFEAHTITVGSGEGLAAAYVHREKGQLVRNRSEVLAEVPEVDTLAALGSRNGATLLPTLRSAWSGETLGHSYVDPAKRLPVPRHTYRLALVAGVQPGRAGALLDDTDGGTPQRFLWVPTTDPSAPDEAGAEPPPWVIPKSPWHARTGGRSVLTIPDEATETIRAARAARLRGDGNALDRHALLCRLKVAAALALLDGCREVRGEDWALSATVMAVSVATRAGVVRQLAASAGEANEARGRAEGLRASVAGEAADELAVKRVGRRIVQKLRGKPSMPSSDVRGFFASRDRGYFGAAVDALATAGVITRTAAGNGEHLALVEASQ